MKNIHGIGEVGVGALLLVQDDLVHFVIGFEHRLSAHVAQQCFELHANGGSTAAAAAVLSAQNDHGVFALHDDVADANFLSYFHNLSNVVPRSGSLGLILWGRTKKVNPCRTI